MDSEVNKYFIRHGLIFGAVSIILSLLFYLLGADFFSSNMFLISIVSILFAIVYPIVITSQFRKANGGLLTFAHGFRIVFFTLLIGGVLNFLFSLLLYHVIDPEYPKILMEKIMERTAEMMKNFGASEESIQEALDNAKSRDQYSIPSQVKGFGIGIVIYAAFALLIGAILKKDQPPFDKQV